MKRAVWIFCLSAALPAHAAEAPKGPLKANCETHVDSDKFVADKNSKSGTWSGNVIVAQCDTRIRANSVRMNLLNGQPDKIFAAGNVVVDSPNSGTATGDNAVYDVKPRLVTLTGHVVLTHEKDVMRGPQLTVNLITGQAQIGGGAKSIAGTPAPGRVQAIFTTPPPSKPGEN
jgi:lipopolysaccharide export system protein LptA